MAAGGNDVRVDPRKWLWLDDLTEDALARAGEMTLGLLRTSHRWIHRRVERVEFKNDASAHHQISVDFTLPLNLPPVAHLPESRPVYVAPLFLVSRNHPTPLTTSDVEEFPLASYTNIDFADGAGNRLPLNTRRQSGRIAAVALRARAHHLLGSRLSGTLKHDITQIAVAGSRKSRDALRSVLETSLDADDPRGVLQHDETFKELAYAFVSHSLVVVWFVGERPDRSLLKLSYDEPVQRQRLSVEEEVRRSLGWKSKQVHMQLTEIGASASYHLEVQIPQELELTEVGLLGERYQVGWNGLPAQPRGFARIRSRLQRQQVAPRDEGEGYLIRQVRLAPEGHIYLPDALGRRVGAGWVKLRARRQGFLVSALLSSMIVAAVLGLYEALAPQIVDADASDAATASLLLLPTLLTTYVARPGEHVITAQMLRWARVALLADGILPLLAAIRLITVAATDKDPDQTLHATWGWLTLCSFGFVLLFAVSNIFPLAHGQPRYVVPTRRVH